MKAGQKTNISVRMKNNVAIRGFQFKLFLPDGVVAQKNSKNKYLATLNNERLEEDDEHTLLSAKQKDGSILFLCGSLYDENFAAGDGEIISVPVEIASDLADGNYPLTIQQTVMTETDINKAYKTDLVKSTIVVGEGGEEDYIPGDVNSDLAVNVQDYTGVANFILGNTPEDFNEKAADVNNDGVINVQDYTGIANIILGFDESNNARGMIRTSAVTDVMDNVIYPGEIKIADADKGDYIGKEFEMSFYLKSSAAIRGFQFDLYLPEGMEAVKSKKGKYTMTWNEDALPEDDEHNLNASAQKDGSVRFLCSSLYDETFVNGDIELFTLKVKLNDDVEDGAYKIQLKDMVLCESDIEKVYKADLIEGNLLIGDKTVGIRNINAERATDGTYYDLSGRKLNGKPEKGVYILNGKKILVK